VPARTSLSTESGPSLSLGSGRRPGACLSSKLAQRGCMWVLHAPYLTWRQVCLSRGFFGFPEHARSWRDSFWGSFSRLRCGWQCGENERIQWQVPTFDQAFGLTTEEREISFAGSSIWWRVTGLSQTLCWTTEEREPSFDGNGTPSLVRGSAARGAPPFLACRVSLRPCSQLSLQNKNQKRKIKQSDHMSKIRSAEVPKHTPDLQVQYCTHMTRLNLQSPSWRCITANTSSLQRVSPLVRMISLYQRVSKRGLVPA